MVKKKTPQNNDVKKKALPARLPVEFIKKLTVYVEAKDAEALSKGIPAPGRERIIYFGLKEMIEKDTFKIK